MSTIRVITKQPGMVNEAKIEQMEKGLSHMQALVSPPSDTAGSSLIECVRIPELSEHGVDLWVNEEGKFNGCEPNFQIFGGRDTVMGPVFFASSNDEGDTVSLTDKQIAATLDWLKSMPQSIF